MLTSGDQGSTVKEYKLKDVDQYVPSQVLSEGEQNVCALADFLTEVNLDTGNCGMIFDDPVTSLDHVRKDGIAKRLVHEATKRQVIVFTHDVVFMSYLVQHASDGGPSITAHWMRSVNGTPGHVEQDSSPHLANVASRKKHASDVVADYAAASPRDKRLKLIAALDHLRAACEALIEEKLFAKTVQRHVDQIKVQNLEEVILDQSLVERIVKLHGKISGLLASHNKSDVMAENPPGIGDFRAVQQELEDVERDLGAARSAAVAARNARKTSQKEATKGWGS